MFKLLVNFLLLLVLFAVKSATAQLNETLDEGTLPFQSAQATAECLLSTKYNRGFYACKNFNECCDTKCPPTSFLLHDNHSCGKNMRRVVDGECRCGSGTYFDNLVIFFYIFGIPIFIGLVILFWICCALRNCPQRHRQQENVYNDY